MTVARLNKRRFRKPSFGPWLPAPTHRAKKATEPRHGDALRTCTTASLGKGLASVCRVPPAICPPDAVAPVAGSNHSTESVPDAAFKSTASALPLDVYPKIGRASCRERV